MEEQQHDILSAFALHQSGALKEAETAYRHILADYPQDAEVQHYLGVLLHQMGNTSEAISVILSAMALDNRHACRYNDLGNIYTQSGDLEKAAIAFGLSLERNAEDANVWNNFGSVLHRQKDLVRAEAAYRNAIVAIADFVPALNNLAALLAETGQEVESAQLTCQAYIQPPFEGKTAKMLAYAYYNLGRLADAAECYRIWLKTEPDNAFAQHHLAACSGKNVPDKASVGYLTELFNDMAGHFEDKLVSKLMYCGPAIIQGLLNGLMTANNQLAVLDGGCGTGLCAPVLVPYAQCLTGVDISQGMLAKAAEKQCYDVLVEMELTAYLSDRKNTFDLIVMADTLIYFGELTGLFANIRQALWPSGYIAFTVEAIDIDPHPIGYQLNASGRYSHSQSYLRQLLESQDFTVLKIQEVIVRLELGSPIKAFGVLALQRTPGERDFEMLN